MIFAAQSIPFPTDLIKTLLDMGTIGIVLMLMLIGAVLFLAINKRERASDKEQNANTAALIKALTDQATNTAGLIKAIDELRSERSGLAGSLESVAKAIANIGKISSDYQKLIDGSLEMVREAMEAHDSSVRGQFDTMRKDVEFLRTWAAEQHCNDITDKINEILVLIQKISTSEINGISGQSNETTGVKPTL